ncbi:VWA domain-containing protein [Asanoa sp. NPDC049573]|uniref:vWA domain-containing protein n=1 Tax=Asanoa sp. NPDC049573 TaxID=3155396 RepID=UPI00341C477D
MGVIGTTVAAAPPPVPQLELGAVQKAAKIDEVPAQYVILADTSGSMQQNNRYIELRKALRQFFAALAPNDRLTLLTFDRKPRLAYDGPVGTSPDNLIKRLPGSAKGAYTDVGAAINQAVTVLAKAKPSVASVVLVTDGRHEPPSGTSFPYSSGSSWVKLRERAATLPQAFIHAYALPVGSDASGARLLGSVFRGRTTNLDPAAVGQITKRLQQPKAQAQADKLRSLLTDDMKSGVEARWPDDVKSLEAGENELVVTLHSTARYLPLVISDTSIDVDGPDVSGSTLVPTTTLEPGQDLRVPITVDWAAGPRTWAFRTPATTSYTLNLTTSLASPWSNAAKQVGLKFEPTATRATEAGMGADNLGRPWAWILGYTVLAILLFGSLYAAYRYPRLSGVLTVTAPGVPGTGLDVPLAGGGWRMALQPAVPGVGVVRVHGRRRRGRSALVVAGGAPLLPRRMLLTIPPDELRMERSVGFRWQSRPVAPTAGQTPPMPVDRPVAHGPVPTPRAEVSEQALPSANRDSDPLGTATGPDPHTPVGRATPAPEATPLRPTSRSAPNQRRPGVPPSATRPAGDDPWADLDRPVSDEPGARFD